MRARFPIGWLVFFALLPLPLSAGQLVVDIGRGPVTVHIPTSYDPARPIPLVLNLHGYTNTGAVQEAYFGLLPLAEQREFLYAFPTGNSDLFGNPFWNGTDACCDLFGSGVDDSTYLSSLVDAIRDQLSVDPWSVHFTGHSNGGFMSYRMACDHADMVASIASLAGATYLAPLDCQPVSPVHILQIHGTSDSTILYGGGATTSASYPGALQTTETWSTYNGCTLNADLSEPPRDVDANIAGAESAVRIYSENCSTGGSARLWTVPSGPHSPALAQGFRDGVVDFLLGHPKAGLLFTDRQTLNWSPLRWAVDYRVYRGALSDLFDNNGDGLADPGYGVCISASDPDPTDTTLSAPVNPTSGNGYFYLLGFVDGNSNASILGTAGNGAPRLPAAVCP